MVLSGCSGGGKSSLLTALCARGFSTVEEPGRRVVRSEVEQGGGALPWIDLEAFALAVLALAKADLAASQSLPGWVFFDRGLVDAASALEQATGRPAVDILGSHRPYHNTVFLTPPLPEIYVIDPECRHGLLCRSVRTPRNHTDR